MKNVRIIATFVLALALCSTAALAQGHGRGKGGQYRNLNLTDDQKTQIHQIHAQQKAQMEDLSKKSLTRQEFRSQASAIRRSSSERVSSILTPDQRAKMAANRKTMGKHGRHAAAQNS